MNRLIAVGDIHGEVGMLHDLLNQIQPQPDDRLVFLGDYIDRGPDSAEVVESLIELRDNPKLDTVFLRGNHEDMYLNHLRDGRWWDMWMMNGGRDTIDSYAVTYPGIDVPERHEGFLRSLDIFHVKDGFVFVHAGLLPNVDISHQLQKAPIEVFVWTRDHLKAERHAWESEYTVVCGHTPHPEPLVKPDLICLDTGACFDRFGTLTAMDVLTGETWQTHRTNVHVSTA